MEKQRPLTFPSFFAETVRQHPDANALAFAGEKPITYSELDQKIQSIIALLEKLQIRRGDKVAILSSNMPNWGATYFAITFMGAVVVPLLPDFHPEEIGNIMSHSGSKAIFVSRGLLAKLGEVKNMHLSFQCRIDDFSVCHPDGIVSHYDPLARPEKKYTVSEDDLAALIYTSGTTGKSKGVMLTHKNICFSALGGRQIQYVDHNDRFLSVLPLSHTYENTVGFIIPMMCGSCVYYLDKPPSPSVLLPAMQKVRPTMMLTVPLIMEKIYRNRILPSFTSRKPTRFLYSIPFIRKRLNLLAGKKLKKTFGGHIKFYGIGGAKLDPVVEKFLIEARFPYAIGYGLTETAPLLAGVNPHKVRLESTGPALDGVELKIHDPHPETGEGEIWAKGPNVMQGYFKEPELTRQVITPDGWFRTGDLGKFDRDRFLYIKGRSKNVIVMPGGENIYPEEIESVINNFNFVLESLVIEKKGKLVALVHFNQEELEKKYQYLKEEVRQYVEKRKTELSSELHAYVNARVNKFSRLQSVVSYPQPFQKTATQKIKRFLYV
ncbi:MAG: AMP-binding protein [Bacteroidales bacterium]|nr:AMP-binding protein [Bacteroidales bacterium]